MDTYHKIENVFNRDPKTHKLIENDWKCEEFEYLKDCQWDFTEKVDGTNIRVIYVNGEVTFKGKTDNAQIPEMLLEKLNELFPLEKMERVFQERSVCLYGEGFGVKIQSGGGYLSKTNDFILFDVKLDRFLMEDEVSGIAGSLGIIRVPIVLKGTLNEGVSYVKKGFRSQLSETPLIAEGLIAKPLLPFKSIRGNRIICKIKYKDLLGT